MKYHEKLNFYLAGKITEDDWRNELLIHEWRTHKSYEEDSEIELPGMNYSSAYTEWKALTGAVLNRFSYTGPFPCSRGQNYEQHAVSSEIYNHCSVDTQIAINELCLSAIRKCDFFFAWIDSYDAFGTLVELGYAKALGKQVWIAFSREMEIPGDHNYCWEKSKDELWFARRTAHNSIKASTPKEGLEYFLNFYGLYTESPIEQLLWVSMSLGLRMAAVPQHKIGKYRADFAFPDLKLAIECDGHDYHKSKDQRTHDARRDRYFKSEGWQVLRFTGTEIHNGPMDCASEITKECRRICGGSLPRSWIITLDEIWEKQHD